MELEAVLKKILDRFNDDFQESSRIRALEKIISEGADQYKYAEEMAREVGKILNGALRTYLPEALTNGMLYRKAAEVVLKQPMLKAVKPVSDAASSVQKNINAQAGIGINPIIPEVNEDQVNGIITGICNAESYESGKETLFDQVENFLEGHVDDSIHDNAGFQYEAGLDPTVTRSAAAKCCKWCDQLAGTYDYEKVRNKGNDVWRRHKNCHCIIDYNPGGKNKNNLRGNIRQWTRTSNSDNIKSRPLLPMNLQLFGKMTGAERAEKFSKNWQKASLRETVERFSPGSKGVYNGSKILYTSLDKKYEVVYDPLGNYFRICDLENTTKKNCVALDGTSVANILVNGKWRGTSKAEYEMLTHFYNTDESYPTL